VGIGTASPSSKLEVDGWIGRTAHNNGGLVGSYNNVGANSANSNPIYVIGSNYKPASTTLDNMYGIGYSHTNASFINSISGSWGMYVASDGDARIWLASSAGASSYFNAGNVGIGTTAPSEKLDVYGATKNIEITNTDETDAGIIFNDAQATTTQYAKITYGSSDNDLNFLNASATPRMVIESSGEVGIGTVSPAYSLHVNSTTGIAGLYSYHTANPAGFHYGVYGYSTGATGGNGNAGLYGYAADNAANAGTGPYGGGMDAGVVGEVQNTSDWAGWF